ncbi:hypothetical protein M0R45_002120 [Rubus argutus]|uniref:Uncharacterized protein n=1 Tax=Rubus argutus TaxID=59490 RepID=A0AAW1VJH2_RUBAR
MSTPSRNEKTDAESITGHQNLRSLLEKMVVASKSVLRFLFPPIDERRNNNPITSTSPVQRAKRNRVATLPAGQIEVSFKLSEKICANGSDIEMERKNETTSPSRQLSFFERLEGWKIERKQRQKGQQSDVYYRHLKSKIVLRTIGEVVEFMLDGKYPNKQVISKDRLYYRHLKSKVVLRPVGEVEEFMVVGKYPDNQVEPSRKRKETSSVDLNTSNNNVPFLFGLTKEELTRSSSTSNMEVRDVKRSKSTS